MTWTIECTHVLRHQDSREVSCGPQPQPLADVMRAVLKEHELAVGDVLVLGTSETLTLRSLVVTFDPAGTAVGRDPHIVDIYNSSVSDELLALTRCGYRAQHTQIRQIDLTDGSHVWQAAIYPDPPRAKGVRLWCDPPLILLFCEARSAARLVLEVRPVQALWEVLRDHHVHPAFDAAPAGVLDPETGAPPGAAAERARVEWAVTQLTRSELPMLATHRSVSTKELLEKVIDARQVLMSHQDRLARAIHHSHGSAQDKIDVLGRRISASAWIEEHSRPHLLAPHRHIVDGLRETERDLQRVSRMSAESASLISNATVARLLDRSDANRITGATVAALLVVVSLVTTFTSVVALPPEMRKPDALERAVGAFGGAALVLVLFLLSLRWAASRGSHGSERIQKLSRHVCVAAMVGAAGTLAWDAFSPSLWATVVPLILVLVTAFAFAYLNEY